MGVACNDSVQTGKTLKNCGGVFHAGLRDVRPDAGMGQRDHQIAAVCLKVVDAFAGGAQNIGNGGAPTQTLSVPHGGLRRKTGKQPDLKPMGGQGDDVPVDNRQSGRIVQVQV
nr:hypothetical protein [Phaeobacter marinintestinus]